MSINYEALFWVLVTINVVGLVMIIRLLDKIDEMKNEVECWNKRLMTIQGDLERVGRTVNIVSDRLIEAHSDILELFDDELDEEDEDEDCEWTPEPDEDDLKAGEVATLGELTIEVDEDPIHIITPNQYFFEQGHDKFDLEHDIASGALCYTYYDTDGHLVHFIISNVSECIGDGLKYFGVNSKNEDVVYIRNNVYHADFMIKKVNYDGR